MAPKKKKKRKKARSARTKTSPKAVETALKHEDWCQKRIAGWSNRDIANYEGITYHGVYQAITKRMQVAGLPEARELLELNLERLDALLKELWPKRNDLHVVDRIIKILDQSRRLLQPSVTDVISPNEGQTIYELMCSAKFTEWIKARDNGAPSNVVDVKATVRTGKNGGNGR